MIYIFTQRNDVERIFAYKTHFGASAILIKEVKNSATNDQWKIVESFLLPLHLLHLISVKLQLIRQKKCSDRTTTTRKLSTFHSRLKELQKDRAVYTSKFKVMTWLKFWDWERMLCTVKPIKSLLPTLVISHVFRQFLYTVIL